MTAAQKLIAVLGVVTIGVTSFFAPYRVQGHNELERIAHDGRVDSYGYTVYASLWDSPRSGAYASDGSMNRMDDVQLDAGKMGLWWAGIIIVTALGIVLAAPRRKPESQASVSTIAGS